MSRILGNYSAVKKVTVDESAIILKILTKKMKSGTLVDVGACQGSVSLPFAKKNWNVIAFEPDPDNYLTLYKNLSGFENISIFNYAISDKEDEEIEFYSSDQSVGISSLAAFTDSHTLKCVVKTRKLYNVLKENKIKNVDFLKIDAEGFDYVVIKSLGWDEKRRTRAVFPKLIMCEFDNKKNLPSELNYSVPEIANYLISYGYKVYVSEWYPIKRYGSGHSFKCLKTYPCKISKNAWGNIIAFNEELHISDGEVRKAFKNYISIYSIIKRKLFKIPSKLRRILIK